jgi:6-phosphofructokinase 1
MKRIAVLTSGGDAPGMNPAIRAVVRMAHALGLQVYGCQRGYQGLMDGAFQPMMLRDVGGIIGRGGTILQTARCLDMKTPEGRTRAVKTLEGHGVEGLVIIGGNGSHAGAYEIFKLGFPVVTIPSTIDNDLCYTDVTIGVDTALNTVLDAIDKIRDTASSLQRAFLIETMGRDTGYLALMGGIAGGAEIILIPEAPMPLEQVYERLKGAYARGKHHAIIVVAEGYKPGTQAVFDYLQERKRDLGFTLRQTILGYLQRGGAPSAFERILATRLGTAAVQAMAEGNYGVMVGLVGNKLEVTALSQVVQCRKGVDLRFYELAEILESASLKPVHDGAAAEESSPTFDKRLDYS